jgi:hypothetical protein
MHRIIATVGALLLLITISLVPGHNRAVLARLFGKGRFERSVITRCYTLAQKRKQEGFYGRHALVLQSPKAATYVLLGAINGSSSSYQRIIDELKKKRIVAEDLTIIAPDTSIIIVGPLGNESPMELLSDLCKLMEKNPLHVFVVRGDYEDKGQWMQEKLGKIAENSDPESDSSRIKLRTFLNTLPLALYLYPWGSDALPVRISWDGEEEESGLACRLVEHKQPIKAICSVGDSCSIAEPPLGVQIMSSPEGVAWETMNGLQFSSEPLLWHFLSNPTSGLEQKTWLSYDAYALLTMEKTLESSTIELVSNRSGAFKSEARFNLVSGKSAITNRQK